MPNRVGAVSHASGVDDDVGHFREFLVARNTVQGIEAKRAARIFRVEDRDPKAFSPRECHHRWPNDCPDQEARVTRYCKSDFHPQFVNSPGIKSSLLMR